MAIDQKRDGRALQSQGNPALQAQNGLGREMSQDERKYMITDATNENGCRWVTKAEIDEVTASILSNKTSESLNKPATGLRFNTGKLKLSWVPTSLIKAVAEVLMKNSTDYGGKYPRHNWRLGMSMTDVYESGMRHQIAWLEGEDLDPEDGIHHLKKAATNLAFLVEYLETHPECDDRPNKPKSDV